MVAQNTTKNLTYCLTDHAGAYQKPIIPTQIPSGLEVVEQNAALKPGILPDGQYLYFDLDVVIVDNIDCFEFTDFGYP